MFAKKESSSNIWMSFTDLLISSLIVFILISITSSYETVNKGRVLDGMISKYDSLISKYKDLEGIDIENIKLKVKIDSLTGQNIKTSKLLDILDGKIDSLTGKNIDFGFNEGDLANIEGITVTEDGKIRFTNFELFQTNHHMLSLELKAKLAEIWPIVINKIDSIKSKGYDVWEIRIEGHTDSRPLSTNSKIDQGNLGLSQRRAAQTWIYIQNNLMSNEPDSTQKYISKRIVTLGFGDKKLLNTRGKQLNENGGVESLNLSRRIEISLLSRPNSENKY